MNKARTSILRNRRKSFSDFENNLLIAEYQRLCELKKVAIEEFNKRFDIYLTAFTAAIAGIIAILQFVSGDLQAQLITIITIVMLVLGWNIFTSLGSANVWNIHLERATRLIQGNCIEKVPQLSEYFYFRKPLQAIIGTNFLTLIIRGISTGGQKSIVILANSAAITYLLQVLLNYIGWEQLLLTWFQDTLLLITFLTSCFIHVLYSWWFYRANGIQ